MWTQNYRLLCHVFWHVKHPRNSSYQGLAAVFLWKLPFPMQLCPYKQIQQQRSIIIHSWNQIFLISLFLLLYVPIYYVFTGRFSFLFVVPIWVPRHSRLYFYNKFDATKKNCSANQSGSFRSVFKYALLRLCPRVRYMRAAFCITRETFLWL